MNDHHQLELLAWASLTDEACPPPDALAAHMLNLLRGNEQLEVAAHVRGCPLCQSELLLARPPAPRPRLLVARLLPGLVAGVRGPGGSAQVRQYRTADLMIELTIAPTEGDYWRLTGQLLRREERVAEQQVKLRAGRRKTLERQSDADGFFTFEHVPAGRYTLTVSDSSVAVQVRDILLAHEDE